MSGGSTIYTGRSRVDGRCALGSGRFVSERWKSLTGLEQTLDLAFQAVTWGHWSGEVQWFFDAEALGLSLPRADAQLGCILPDAVHLLAHPVEAVLGLAT